MVAVHAWCSHLNSVRRQQIEMALGEKTCSSSLVLSPLWIFSCIVQFPHLRSSTCACQRCPHLVQLRIPWLLFLFMFSFVFIGIHVPFTSSRRSFTVFTNTKSCEKQTGVRSTSLSVLHVPFPPASGCSACVCPGLCTLAVHAAPARLAVHSSAAARSAPAS